MPQVIISRLVLCLAVFSTALCAEPEKLQKSRSGYEGAVARSLAPIQKTYLLELEKLKSEFTRAGKLEDALAVADEIKKLSPGSSATATTGTPASGAKPTKNQIEKILLGTKWIYTERGEAEDKPGAGPGNVIEFQRTGKASINGAIETLWKLDAHGELIYRIDTPKYICTLKLQSDGVFGGKCTGTSADALGFVHLTAQTKP